MPFKDYRVTSGFGWRTSPISGHKEWHTGIDLVKSHKAPIYAFTDGEVIFAGVGKSGSGLGGYGNVVLIKDKNSRGQLYAHLDSVSVKKGQLVTKGQEIGKQGNKGQSAGSHLHYEVRKKAEDKTPYGWIVDRENNCLNPELYLTNFTGEVNAVAENKDQVSTWAKDAYKWAVEKGITDGKKPKNIPTKEEVITMIWRAAGSPKV